MVKMWILTIYLQLGKKLMLISILIIRMILLIRYKKYWIKRIKLNQKLKICGNRKNNYNKLRKNNNKQQKLTYHN